MPPCNFPTVQLQQGWFIPQGSAQSKCLGRVFKGELATRGGSPPAPRAGWLGRVPQRPQHGQRSVSHQIARQRAGFDLCVLSASVKTQQSTEQPIKNAIKQPKPGLMEEPPA